MNTWNSATYTPNSSVKDALHVYWQYVVNPGESEDFLAYVSLLWSRLEWEERAHVQARRRQHSICLLDQRKEVGRS